MGNGTKVALVALLILMVVVIARFVRRDTEPNPTNEADAKRTSLNVPPAKGTPGITGKTPAQEPPKDRGKTIRSRGATGKSPATRTDTSNRGRKTGPQNVVKPARTTPPISSSRKSPGAGGTASAQTNNEFPVKTGLPGDEPKPAGKTPAGTEVAKAGPPPVSVEGEKKPGLVNNFKPVLPKGATAKEQEAALANVAFKSGPGPRLGAQGERFTSMNPVTERKDPKSSTPPITPKPGDRKFDSKSTPPTSTVAGYPKKHKIAQNDSFWKLATKYYGRATPKLVEHIQKSNPSIDAKKMTLGKTVIIPAPPKVAPRKPTAVAAGKAPSKPKSVKPRAPSTPKTYKVKQHDTLTGLAKAFYGDPNKYDLIKQANESLHYQDLMAGSTIIIPPLR